MSEGRGRVVAVSPIADVAGGETALLRLLPGLERLGWEVAATIPGPGRLADAAAARGIPTRRLPLGRPERRSAGAYAGALAAGIVLRDADVCLLNGLPAQRVVPALRRRGVPAVVRVNNPLPARPAAWSRPAFWETVRAVIADSEHTAGECVAMGAPRDRVQVCLPAAWDGSMPPPAGPGRRPVPVVGFVGRIEERKGLDVLLDATEALAALGRGVRLVIAGEPPPGGEVWADRVLGRARRAGAEVLGFVSDVPGLLSGFDLLCVPSREEPLGTVAAEAAASGVPVACSAVGGLVEVVADGETGLCVSPGDPAALAGAIGALVADPGRLAAIGAEARSRAGRFSPDSYAEAVDRILRGAIPFRS